MLKAFFFVCTFLFIVLTPHSRGGDSSGRQLPSSPPCDNMSQMEMNECFDREFRKASERLNHLSERLLSSMEKELADAEQEKAIPENSIHYREQIQKLRAAESAWLTYRDLHCDAAEHQYEGGTMASMVLSICKKEVTEHRIEELGHAYEFGDAKSN